MIRYVRVTAPFVEPRKRNDDKPDRNGRLGFSEPDTAIYDGHLPPLRAALTSRKTKRGFLSASPKNAYRHQWPIPPPKPTSRDPPISSFRIGKRNNPARCSDPRPVALRYAHRIARFAYSVPARSPEHDADAGEGARSTPP